MENLMIQNCSIDDLKSIIAEAISNNKQPVPETPSDEYLTRAQTADKLSVSLPTLNEYTKKGIIIGYRFGSRVRYKKQEIDSALIKVQTSKFRRN